MPPPVGRPYEYSPPKVRRVVQQEPGVYWLRTEDGISYIGESTDLKRRLLEHSHKEPVRFQYNTLDMYCKRYPVSVLPWMSDKELCYKIESTEFAAYKARFGELPPLNRQDNHYEEGVLEETLDYILTTGNQWL